MSDLERAFRALKSKASGYTTLFDYAEGDQPLRYSTQRLKEAFRSLTVRFNQNWVSVVVESALDRLVFKGWSTGSPALNKQFSLIFEQNQISIESYDAHKAALITHESYIIAWKGEEGLEVYYNDPRMCHLFYQADNPKKKEFGCKWYQDDLGCYHLILYYEDRLEYYETEPRKSAPTGAGAFHPSDPDRADNPYKTIPVFHFTTSRRSAVSELTNIITLQDAVNKLFADMMVAAEFGAFKQRWIISNSDTGSLKNAPNEIWTLPPGDGIGQGTQVGEFAEVGLDNFLNAIDKIANSIAIISRTPKHYFYSSGANVSGEALIAMEAPLTAKVEQYQKAFGVAWLELGSFLMKLSGEEVSPIDIRLIWEPVQSVQPLTEAQTLKTLQDSKVPLEIALKWAGKSESEIKEVTDLLAKQKEADATQAKLMLERLRLQNQQSNEEIPAEQGINNQEPE